MINIDDYFEVDWIETGCRLKGLLKERVSLEALAEWADRDVKTIRNWLKNPASMGFSRLLVIAKFLGMDLDEIVVLKGKYKDLQACQNIVDAEDEVVADFGELDGSKKNRNTLMCVNAQQFTRRVIYNEWRRHFDEPCEEAPIQSMREFLLYLPLFDLADLSDFIYRTMGDVCDNMRYVYERLNDLYRGLAETDAKRYADHMKYFCLTQPNVARIIDEDMCVSVVRRKYEEFEEYLGSKSFDLEAEAYFTACRRASKRLLFREHNSMN